MAVNNNNNNKQQQSDNKYLAIPTENNQQLYYTLWFLLHPVRHIVAMLNFLLWFRIILDDTFL